MKKVIAIAALAVLAGSAYAQLNPLPAPSSTDGVNITSSATNLDSSHWGNAGSLAAYQFNSNAYLTDPNTGSPDNRLGLHWASSASASLNSIFTALDSEGGFARIIYLGKSAGWLNDLGYTYTGDPTDLASSYSVWRDIPVGDPTPAAFGSYVDISLAAGDASTFDVWLNASGSYDTSNPSPTTYGGYYTGLHQTNSNPYNAPGNARLTQEPLMVNTWIDALSQDYWVSTYLLSFEDWRLDRGADRDFNDVMVALQFFHSDGTPFTPVPEPSTYGLIGGIALLGLVLRRRFAKK
ncbi:hypothetical protein DB347_13685 [Opitutaceae bacterium EW11]|nr:hypothetical protein DB347_13685 [Opitutaceae bacterium EW11]